jgi:phosphatidylserine/phosphatidylglycerophosphate/cardiolipin synthase-like enzyme
MKPETIAALFHARRRTDGEQWMTLANKLLSHPAPVPQKALDAWLAAVPNSDSAWAIKAALMIDAALPGVAVGASMLTVDHMDLEQTERTELMWTGPRNGRFPIRRIDQVLYDLIARAQRRILLVTYAAHRVPHLCRHLEDALHRGVDLRLIVECEEASEGQLSSDAKNAFPGLPEAGAKLFYWPLAKRERNQAGRPGKLHAKCAVVDDVALVGSANLTDDAFNRNMELGVLLKDADTVSGLLSHFEELVASGTLERVA